ncbi:MAG: beta strand repeat-containing protein, partial [Terriglobales bacterium]
STSGQTINLASQANLFGTNSVSLNTSGALGTASIASDSLNLGTSTVGGSLTATAATGGITESGVIQTGANGSNFTTSTSSQTINLATQANLFGANSVSLNTSGAAGAASIASDSLNFGTSLIGGALSGEATTGNLTESGAITAGAGSNVKADAGNIDLSTQANTFGTGLVLNTSGAATAAVKAGTLDFGASSVAGAITAEATTGTITQSGVVSSGNNSSFKADAGSINLATQTNSLGTGLALNASGTAAVKEAAVDLGASTVGGALAAEATTGNITQSGVISSGNGSTITADAGNINLSTQTNNFTGAVALFTSGTATAAIKSATLDFGASIVGGAITAEATTGNLTESGAISAGSGSVFKADAGNIDLSTQANTLAGQLMLIATDGSAAVKSNALGAGAAADNTEIFAGNGSINVTTTTGGIQNLSAAALNGNITVTSAGNISLLGVDADVPTSTTPGTVTMSANGTSGSITQAAAFSPTNSQTQATANDISVRGTAVTLTAGTLGSSANYDGILTNNLTLTLGQPTASYFAVSQLNGQALTTPPNINNHAQPVTHGVSLTLPGITTKQFLIGSDQAFIVAADPALGELPALGAIAIGTISTVAAAPEAGAFNQSSTSGANGVQNAAPDASISLFNIVGLCLPADQREDEDAAKQENCIPEKTTFNLLPRGTHDGINASAGSGLAATDTVAKLGPLAPLAR